MKRLNFITLIFLFFFISLLNCPYAKVPDWQNDKVKITLYPQYHETQNLNEFQLLIKAQLRNGWHVSWDNPGDAGVPVTFNFNLPQGWKAEKTAQTTPQKFIYDGIISQYGYSQTAYYLYQIQMSENNIQKQNIPFSIDWVACKDYCEPETADFSIPSPFQGGRTTLAPHWAEEIKQARLTFPQQTAWKVFAENIDYFLKIRIESQGIKFDLAVKPFYFIPFERHIFSAGAKQTKTLAKDGALEIFIDAEEDNIIPQKGILIYGEESYLLEVQKTGSAADGQSIPLSPANSLISILALAFAGGLILNLMPCIFPILSIKAISLAQSANRKRHWLSGLLYMSGVIACFVLIAAILYVLRRQGEAAGWGFQLQSPIFVSIMLIFFLFILLMLFDVFTPQGRFLNVLNRFSSANSFLTGFFAVLIASPCTGPFMGAALGYAVLQPAQIYFPIFISLAFGYALPFALIEIFPALIQKILPRPGKWMTVLKRILALPVLLTCVWLGWVLYNELSNPSKSTSLEAPSNSENIKWQEYAPENLQNLIDQGEPVFIDFTAKWCITCLVNEKTSLDTEHFARLVHDRHIALIKADWTTRNETIAQALKQYGRNSIPLYVFYPGKKSDYIILPQILTPQTLEKHLKPAEPDL